MCQLGIELVIPGTQQRVRHIEPLAVQAQLQHLWANLQLCPCTTPPLPKCAHNTRLTHRDIKPENMLLDWRDVIQLNEFGIAVVAHSSRSQSTQQIIGSVCYMAPEQIQGKPRPSSDQCALSVVAYEWLCGSPPLHGATAEITAQHLHTDPPPLRQRVPDIPPALEAVVLRASEKDPHRRCGSEGEFATAFEQASQGFLPAETALMPHSASFLSPGTHAREEATFHAQLTLAESTPGPLTTPTRRLSRRALLVGALGAVGLAGTPSGLA